MPWEIKSTETFSNNLKKYKKEPEFMKALDNKIKRLIENPESVGGYLSGRLHGFKSTRIIRKFRLIFKISLDEHSVFLCAIDHRKFDYENFSFD